MYPGLVANESTLTFFDIAALARELPKKNRILFLHFGTTSGSDGAHHNTSKLARAALAVLPTLEKNFKQ